MRPRGGLDGNTVRSPTIVSYQLIQTSTGIGSVVKPLAMNTSSQKAPYTTEVLAKRAVACALAAGPYVRLFFCY